MLTRTLAAASVAVIAGALSLGAVPAPASAAAMFGTPPAFTTSNANVQLADYVVKKKVVKKNGNKVTKTTTTKKVVKKNGNTVVTRKTAWRYDPGRNGHRYRHREGAYVYYYDGYYYDRPWWTIAVPGVNLCIGC